MSNRKYREFMKDYTYSSAFGQVYDKLSREQKKAVDQLEGPVMAIAGPGTGKTQILSSRTGKTLAEGHAAPGSILCLTSTDEGLSAMRSRLISLTGPDTHKVVVYTFHAFCNDIIQDNLPLFGETSPDVISDLEQISLFKQLIDSFKKDNPLKRYRGDVYFEINNLRSLFSTMKKEEWTPAFINEKIDEYVTGLTDREEFAHQSSNAGKWNKGDLKPAYTEELDKMAKLRAAVNEFDQFQQLMKAKNRYDSDDTINRVIKAFEENAGLLASYQEKYRYLMADECQNTSGAWNRLVQLLISSWDTPDIFILSSHLIHRPVINHYETQRQEMMNITLQVEKLLSQQVAPGRIGIIYNENKYGDQLARYFTFLGIPWYGRRNQNILEIPLARKIILVLKYIAAEHDTPYGGDEMLFEILHFDWFGIPPIEIARLSIEVSKKRYGDIHTSIRELLLQKAAAPPRDLFSTGLHEGLKIAGTALESLIADAPNLTLQHLFENIIRKTGAISFIMQSHDKIWLLQVLTGLFDFIKDETRRNPFLNLEQLISTLDLMEKEGLRLPLAHISGSVQGVNLLTAHGSTGLEFEHVFLTGTNAAFWEKKQGPNGGFGFPDTMLISLSKTTPDEELRRLFYVALTRAEKYLTISYSKYRDDGKEMEPSAFIAGIPERDDILVEKIHVDETTIATFSALQFGEAKAPEIGKLDAGFVDRTLEKFSMNVTALNNYLKCPLDFYFRNLVKIPSPKNEATEFGSAVHAALEALFRKMQGNNNRFPPKQEFRGDFERHMYRHRESFTKEQFLRRMEYGPEILSNYYDNYISGFNKVVAIERNIQSIVSGIPIKGKLDKMEFEGNDVNVVDYKTGDPDKARSRLQPPGDMAPNGGDYWRQAVFYKILVDNYQQKDWKVVSTEFDFIEPDKKKNYRREKLIITPADITTVTRQIVQVWEKIRQRDFYTGCGREDCHWCSFVKENKLAVALHVTGEEE